MFLEHSQPLRQQSQYHTNTQAALNDNDEEQKNTRIIRHPARFSASDTVIQLENACDTDCIGVKVAGLPGMFSDSFLLLCFLT